MKATGQITIVNMTEPFSVILTNEAQQFSTNSDRTVTTAQSYYTDIIVYHGTELRTDYTIGSISSANGITVSKTSSRVTFSVTANTTITKDNGTFTIPITLDGETVNKTFSWACAKQGEKGDTGSTGKGISSTIVEYQAGSSGTTAPTGTWETAVPSVSTGQYLWTRTTITYTDKTTSISYAIAYQGTNGKNGEDGSDGKNGNDGRGISNYETTYQAGSSGTTAPTGTWQTSVPTVNNGQYLWTKTVYTFTDKTTQTVYSVGYKGTNGTNGTSVGNVVNYYLTSSSSSGVTTFTTGWTTTIQTISKDKPYLWNYEVVQNTSGGTISTTSPVIIGHFGTDGSNGSKGDTGTSITGIKEHYAVSASSTTAPSTWYDTVQTMDATNKYLWNYETISYSDNTSDDTLKRVIGAYGDKGDKGATGDTGNGISSITEHYATSTKSTDTPTSWQTTPPTMDTTNKYLWNYETITYTDKTTKDTNKRIIGVYGDTGATGGTGATGKGVSLVTNYYLASAASSGVTKSTTGWTDTVQSVSSSKKYLWNYEVITYTDKSTTSTDPCIIGAYGDTGLTGAAGADAKLLTITASSQIFKSTDGGLTFSPSTITLTPILQGGITYSKWQYSTNGGSTWTNVTSGSNGLTISSGVLTISKDSNLYTSSVTAVSFKCISNNASYYDIVTVVKLYDVVDIEIGGRNLIWNSTFKNAGTHWTMNDCVVTYGDDSTYGDYLLFYSTSAGDTNKNRIFQSPFANNKTNHVAGQQYTLSFYAKASSAVTIHGGHINSLNTYSVTTSWQRFVKTYTINSTGSLTFYINTANVKVYLSQIKLEKGNKATDWTPAPEDTDDEFETVKSSVSEVSSTVDKQAQEIANKISKTDTVSVTDSSGNTVEKTISAALTSVTQDLNSYKTTVSNTYSTKTENSQTLTDAKSYTDQKADSITSEVSKSYVSNTTMSSYLTRITQTEKEIGWLVSSSSSDSSLVLTDNALKVIANNIDLTGKVTYNWLSSSAQKTISDYSDSAAADALTAAKTYSGTAVNWISNNSSAHDALLSMVKKWTNNAVSDTTTIQGGWIATNTITASQIASNTITADKMNVSSLESIVAKIGDFTINKALYSNGHSAYNTAVSGVYLGSDYISLGSGGVSWLKNDGSVSLGNGAITYNASSKELNITASSIAIGTTSVATTTDVSNAIDDISVGGRNYALSTRDYATVVGTNTTNQLATLYTLSYDWTHFAEKTITISFDYTLSNGATFTQIAVGMGASTWERKAVIPISSGTSGHVSATWTISSSVTSHKIVQARFDAFTGTIIFSNFKFEIGNKETDWSPAPEDDASLIEQNAENIKLCVGKDGVISAINQTSESITIDASKVNLNGYVTMTNLKTEGETVINGANITTKSITADKLVITDFANYSDLNINTYEEYGFTKVADSSNTNDPWFKLETLQRDTALTPNGYTNYQCSGGEVFRVEYEVQSTVQGLATSTDTAVSYLGVKIGLYGKTSDGGTSWNFGSAYAAGNASGTTQKISTTITLPSTLRSFSVYLQLNGFPTFSGTCKIRNVRVTKMYGGSLIVDGSITAAKIDVNDLFAQNITATGTISGVTITGGTITGGTITGTTLSGATGSFSGTVTASYITANYGKIANFTITDGFIFNGINIGTAKSCGIGAGTSLGGNDEWIFWAGNGNFRVNIDGYSHLENANIVGSVTATTLVAKESIQLYYSDQSKARILAETTSDSGGVTIGSGFGQTTLESYAWCNNGLYVADGTGINTITAQTSIAAGANVRIYSDSEGGNIELTAPNGTMVYSFDTLNNGFRLYQWTANSYCAPLQVSEDGVIYLANMVWRDTNSEYQVWFNSNHNIIPTALSGTSAPNVVNLGSGSNYFKTLYYGTSLTKKSDRRLKNDLGDLPEDEALTLLTSFKPKKFTMKDDKDSVIQYGAYAQDVRDTLISSGIGHRLLLGIGDTAEDKPIYDLTAPEEDVSYSLDYTQYIPVIIKGWQYHTSKIASLEDRISKLEELINLK